MKNNQDPRRKQRGMNREYRRSTTIGSEDRRSTSNGWAIKPTCGLKLIITLLAILATPLLFAEKFQEIEHKKPKYIKRKSDAWKEGGRIIGEIKHSPETFTIKVTRAGTSKVIYTYTHPAELSIYQTKRLPPGTYDLTIDAKGFSPHKISKIKIKARRDCMLNLIFGLRVFDNH